MTFSKLVSLQRDAVNMRTLVRQSIGGKAAVHHRCGWCRRDSPRFVYGWRDDITPEEEPRWLKGVFCSISCARSFHKETDGDTKADLASFRS